MFIDFYDDRGEAYLQALGDTDLPEFLKTASWKESAELLDRDFALIMVDGEGTEHRKFACFDAGNTEMSMWYLLRARDVLPPAAVKVAAINLAVAAGAYGLDVPQELFDLNVSVEQEWARDILDEKRVKIAQMAPMPATSPARPKMAAPPAAMGQGMAMAQTGGRPSMGMASPMPGGMPRGGFRMPMGPGGMAGAGRTAVASSPYDILEHAVENWDDLDPYDRHDFAVYLCKEGSASGVTVPDHIHQYGGESLNPRFGAIMEHRKRYASSEEVQKNYDDLAKMAGVMDPMEVVNVLHLIDEQASLTPRYGSNIPDPLLSVFGQTKEAEYSWIHGSDMVNEKQLRKFAATRSGEYSLDELYSPEFRKKFRVDPIGVFKAAPLSQKIVLARLAAQSGYGNDGGHFS